MYQLLIQQDKSETNHLKIGKNHIFINFLPINMAYVKDLLSIGPATRIHIFVSSLGFHIETLSYLIGEMHNRRNEFHRKQVIIHVPRRIRDVAVVLDTKLKDYEDELEGMYDSYGHYHKIIVETNGPRFSSMPKSCNSPYSISFNYTDRQIDVCIDTKPSYFHEYNITPMKETYVRGGCVYTDNEAELYNEVITNRMMKMYPELFKDRIVSLFREYAPYTIGGDEDYENMPEAKIWRLIRKWKWNIDMSRMSVDDQIIDKIKNS